MMKIKMEIAEDAEQASMMTKMPNYVCLHDALRVKSLLQWQGSAVNVNRNEDEDRHT